jgi:DNA-binding GntR family transcriptional regulator
MADHLLVETRMCLTALQSTAPPPEELVAEHRTLCQAVRDGDADLLVATLEAHMKDAVDRIVEAPQVELVAVPPRLPDASPAVPA